MTLCAPDFYPRAWYGAPIDDFLTAQPDAVLGQLATNSDFSVDPTQRNAWVAEVAILKDSLAGFSGTVLLEFNIPRMGQRIDAVLLIGPIVFVVEFKVGAIAFDRTAIEQVWDYALDLKNFHAASHSVPIVPTLVATEARKALRLDLYKDDDNLYRPALLNKDSLAVFIAASTKTIRGATIDGSNWASAPYKPTPTIVEAARALYASHSVEAIARFDAGSTNLRVTSRRV